MGKADMTRTCSNVADIGPLSNLIASAVDGHHSGALPVMRWPSHAWALPPCAGGGGTIMKNLLSPLPAAVSALSLILAAAGPGVAQSTSTDEARLIAQEAYIYLYPLIIMT